MSNILPQSDVTSAAANLAGITQQPAADIHGDTQLYNIPVSHLEYGFIDKCKDSKYVEKILKVLRSGTEGVYPDLERHAEKRLEVLNPTSRVLRKASPLTNLGDLPKDDAENILQDIDNWSNKLKSAEKKELLTSANSSAEYDENLPPVRGSGGIRTAGAPSPKTSKQKTSKSVKPREYRDWDKVNVEEELEKIDQEEIMQKAKASKNIFSDKPNIPEDVDTSGLTDEEIDEKAEREKDKGNEAFRSGDFQEALIYYNRSMKTKDNVHASNNRAQCYIKMERWAEALLDCNWVLDMEPDNLKAFCRRAKVHMELCKHEEALADVQVVLKREPQNKKANDLSDKINFKLKQVAEEKKAQKPKPKRMIIEEVSDSESDSEYCTPPEINESKNGDQLGQENGVTSAEQKGSGVSTTEQKETVIIKPDTEKEETEANNKQDAAQNKDNAAVNNSPQNDDTTLAREDKKIADEVKEEPTAAEKPVVNAPLPGPVSSLKEKGNDMFRRGQYAEAIEEYSKALEKLENKPEQYHNLSVLYNNRAMCKYKIGDCNGCIEDSNVSLELVPDNVKALMRRAMAYDTKEKYGEAYLDYRRVLSLDDSQKNAHQGSAKCMQMLQILHGVNWREKIPKSDERFKPKNPIPSSRQPSETTPSTHKTDKATPSKPKHPDPQTVDKKEEKEEKKEASPPQEDPEKLFEDYKTKGNDLVKTGKFKEAISMYNRCIELFPSRSVPFTNRALCHLRMLKPEKALVDCDYALGCDPKNVKALYRKGLALKMLGKFDAAANAFVDTLKVEAGNKAADKELKEILEIKKANARSKRAKAASASSSSQSKKIEVLESSSSSSSSSEEECPLKKKREAAKANVKEMKSKSATSKPASSPAKQAAPEKPSTESKKSRAKKTKQAAKPEPVELEVVTPYAFNSAWNALKGTKETAPYAKLLEKVEPRDLKKFVSNKLEADMLKMMVRCVGMFIEKGDVMTSFQYLQNLTTVPRFDITVMLLGKQEKQDIGSVLKKLNTHTGDSFSQAELNKVIKAYGL